MWLSHSMMQMYQASQSISNDMTISDGDILAKELNNYGQKYKADCLARIPSQAVAESVGSGLDMSMGCDCSNHSRDSSRSRVRRWAPGVDDVPPEAPIDPGSKFLRPVVPEENWIKLVLCENSPPPLLLTMGLFVKSTQQTVGLYKSHSYGT